MPCKLCQQETPLRESHIIPKFIFKWLKDSGNGYLRNVVNFNQRIQDGFKEKMLCDECENRFSECETYFAKYMFYPLVNDKADSFEYTEKLYYFIVSLAWRIAHMYRSVMQESEQPLFNELAKAEKEWRLFLLEKIPVATFNKIHLLTGVDVLIDDAIELPDRFIQYVARGVDMDVPTNDVDALIYIKLPRFIFFVPLFGFQDAEFLNATIDSSKGVYRCNEVQITSDLLAKYLMARVDTVNKLRENTSLIQKEKMHKTAVDDWPKVKNKDLGIILEYQQRLYDESGNE